MSSLMTQALGGGIVETLYLVSGLLVYMILLALITKVLKQNSLTPERRAADRRQNTGSRRQGLRAERGESRRMGDRRSMYAGVPA